MVDDKIFEKGLLLIGEAQYLKEDVTRRMEENARLHAEYRAIGQGPGRRASALLLGPSLAYQLIAFFTPESGLRNLVLIMIGLVCIWYLPEVLGWTIRQLRLGRRMTINARIMKAATLRMKALCDAADVLKAEAIAADANKLQKSDLQRA